MSIQRTRSVQPTRRGDAETSRHRRPRHMREWIHRLFGRHGDSTEDLGAPHNDGLDDFDESDPGVSNVTVIDAYVVEIDPASQSRGSVRPASLATPESRRARSGQLDPHGRGPRRATRR
jgi:hypothetical protein